MSQTPDRQLRIFVCHAHEDKDEVLKLYRRLQADGFQPWIDKENLLPGQKWETAIRKAVKACDAFVICVSQHSATKQGFVQREIVFALDVAKEQPEDSVFLIPVRMEDCIVPDRVSEWHWCNYFEPDGYDKLVEALCLRAEQLGIPLKPPEPEPEPGQSPRPPDRSPGAKKQPVSFPALPAFSGWIVAAVAVVLLLVGGLSTIGNLVGGGSNTPTPPAPTRTQPTATDVAVVVDPTPEPTATPTPEPTATPTPEPTTATPINPLFPVTLDEWRNETMRSTPNELTREGDHYWRYVPGGTYTIGGWTDDEQNNNDEATDIELPSYSIAKHPVTNQQYREFMQAGGYETREYWTAKGWAWKEAYNGGKGRTQPSYWDDERFNSDNQPVVGVWWYEATAFAAWLNTELADSLPDGMQVRLPTEAEWEVACAYGSDGQRHTYPWGEDEPTRDLVVADFDDGSDPDRAAVVGERAAGAAASGAQDMGGNVWEFTMSDYATFPGTSGDVVGDVDTSTYVPVRGGSWWNDRTYVRCAARYGHPHANDSFIIGLRRLLSPRYTR